MYSTTAKAVQQQQMRRYALWFLLGGVLLTVVLVGLTYSHLLSTPEIQKLQKASVVQVQVMTQSPPVAAGGKVVASGGKADDSASAVEKKKAKTTWKSENFQTVPPEVLAAAGKITVAEETVLLTIDSKELKVHYREAKPAVAAAAAGSGSSTSKSLQVLFLHGARFSSKIWLDIGTLQLVAAMGHHAVAVDLPKSGNAKSQSTADFLQKYISELKLDRPVLVSPSMSGFYSLPYLLLPTAETCTDRVRAFLPIAPGGTSRFTAEDYKQCKAPTMIVYGEKDTTAPINTLSQFLNSAVFQIKDAGHVCYKDDSAEWHRLLYNFLQALSSSP